MGGVHVLQAEIALIEAVLLPVLAQTLDVAVADAARDAGTRSLVHLSAIGANRSSKSAYARTKADGEDRVTAAFPACIILRPSIIFGQEDEFFNRFASMERFSPVMPLIGGGRTRFQPVYVADVAQAVVAGLEGRARPGAP